MKKRNLKKLSLPILRDDCDGFCKKCGSSASKSGFLGLFGKMLCHNSSCKHSKSKKFYK